MYNLRLLAAHSISLRNSKDITPEALLQLTSDSCLLMDRECKSISLQQSHALMASGSLVSSTGPSHGASRSAVWLPIDLFLEDIMEGCMVATTSAAETLAGTINFDIVIVLGLQVNHNDTSFVKSSKP